MWTCRDSGSFSYCRWTPFVDLVEFLRQGANQLSISKRKHCSGYFFKLMSQSWKIAMVLEKWNVSALLTTVSEEGKKKRESNGHVSHGLLNKLSPWHAARVIPGGKHTNGNYHLKTEYDFRIMTIISVSWDCITNLKLNAFKSYGIEICEWLGRFSDPGWSHLITAPLWSADRSRTDVELNYLLPWWWAGCGKGLPTWVTWIYS